MTTEASSLTALEFLHAIDNVVDENGWAYASEIAEELGVGDGRKIKGWLHALRERGLVETCFGSAGDLGYGALMYGLTEDGGDIIAGIVPLGGEAGDGP